MVSTIVLAFAVFVGQRFYALKLVTYFIYSLPQPNVRFKLCYESNKR